MKLTINQWQAVATWLWDIENETTCTICQLPFESPCPKCKEPGDQCVPIEGECSHHFHLHCILKWLEEQTQASEQCPLCRKKWVVKSD